MPWNRLRLTTAAAITLTLALGAQLAVTPASAAVPAVTAATSTQSAIPASDAVQTSLPDATGNITDPVASVNVLRRDCKPGQVELNTATEAAIGEALGIDSEPTLSRIVSGREWLIPDHVVSVPGVGPSKLDRLRTATCATPVALPPATTHHPRAGGSAGEVDLQVAPIDEIMTLGLSRPVSERLAAARPLPDDLHQIAAPSVPGLSHAKIDEIIDRGAVITPAPFIYEGRNWRWASHDHGAVVADADDDRYALIVPPERVRSDGAWATTTKLPDYLGGLPRADFHIYGPWTPDVVGQLPRPAGATSDSLIGWHAAPEDRDVGDRVSMYPNTWVGAETARVPLSSLSEVSVDVNPLVATDPANPASGCQVQNAYSVFCPNGSTGWDLRDGSSPEVFSSKGAYLRSLGYFPYSGEVCDDDGPYVVSTGSLGGAAQCDDIEVSDPNAGFIIKNTSDFTWFNTGIVLRPTQSGPGAMTLNKKNPGSLGFASDVVDNLIIDFGNLPPGSDLVIKVNRGAPETRLTLTGSDITPAYLALAQVTAIGDLLGVVDYGSCSTLGAATSDEIKFVAQCFTVVIEKAAMSRAISAPNGSSDRVLYAGIAKKAAWLGAALTAWDAVTTSLQYATAGTATSTYRYLYPASGSGSSGSASDDGTYIARTEVGQAFLVDTTENEAYEIPDAATFNCLADSRFVVDLVEILRADGRLNLNVDGSPVVVERALTCTPSSVRWDYNPSALGGNVPNGVILKMPDWQGRGSWWINHDGQIETIPNGGVYVCLAAKAPVIYNVPLEKIDEWRPVGTKPAGCV